MSNDITLGIGENLARRAKDRLIPKIRLHGRPESEGDVRFFVDYAGRLEGGRLDFVGPSPNHPIYRDGFIDMRELDIIWDRLRFGVDINLPEISIGGQCILRLPIVGCVARIPRLSVWGRNPDIGASISLNHVIRSEVSVGAAPRVVAGMSDDVPPRPQWHIVPDMVNVDVDLIDIADTVGDLVQRLLDRLVDAALGWLPDWARDIIDAIAGGIVWMIRRLLDLGDDVSEWLARILRHSVGLFNIIAQYLLDRFENDMVLFAVDNPYTLLEASTANPAMPEQPPVLLPIRRIVPSVSDSELVCAITL